MVKMSVIKLNCPNLIVHEQKCDINICLETKYLGVNKKVIRKLSRDSGTTDRVTDHM